MKSRPVIYVSLEQKAQQIYDRITSTLAALFDIENAIPFANLVAGQGYKADDLPRMRMLAYQDLDETMYRILKGTLDYLGKKKGKVALVTLKAFDYYQEIHRKSVIKQED